MYSNFVVEIQSFLSITKRYQNTFEIISVHFECIELAMAYM